MCGISDLYIHYVIVLIQKLCTLPMRIYIVNTSILTPLILRTIHPINGTASRGKSSVYTQSVINTCEICLRDCESTVVIYSGDVVITNNTQKYSSIVCVDSVI